MKERTNAWNKQKNEKTKGNIKVNTLLEAYMHNAL